MIAAGHPEVSVEARCKLLGVARASYYRGPASGLRAGDLELMRQIDKLYLQLYITIVLGITSPNGETVFCIFLETHTKEALIFNT